MSSPSGSTLHHFVVLGGGITGLSSAFHLSRRFPNASITIVEKEDRLGGWIKSERASVRANDNDSCKEGSVVLEAGPRTLRPVDKAVLELIHLLDLTSEVITMPTSSPAAKSRYLHVPELTRGRGNGLLRLPSDLWSLLSPWSESWPLSRILLPAVLKEPFGSANRPVVDNVSVDGEAEAEQDESVDAFMTRRFGGDFARVFGSALVHGIYAADSRELSVRAAFPSLWDAETRGNGSMFLGMFRRIRKDEEEYEVGDLVEKTRGVSVLSFKEGIEVLPKALERYLLKENVRIIKGKGVTKLRMREDEQIEVYLSPSEVLNATHVVSALPLPVLHNLLPGGQELPHLNANPFSTVTVVNLVFAVLPDKIHPAGFGYLVPHRPDPEPADTLPIIGTVFDSCSLSAQDNPPVFTKITVMIKGDYPLLSESKSAVPELILRILSALSAHLGGSLPDPVFWRVHVNRGCIPTYRVGHRGRMKELAKRARDAWRGRLEVVGSGVGGVSVNDCIKGGRSVGHDWV
ncbi:hypothetical protein AX15_001419 [Amanita polypyramis BW_CC]|nr:hypothetical protein AX15_001419 [Amanita polypyramis BW_CC]